MAKCSNVLVGAGAMSTWVTARVVTTSVAIVQIEKKADLFRAKEFP